MSEFKIDSAVPRPALIEFAGQWVAWNKGRTDIVAHGKYFAEVHSIARAKGFPDAVFSTRPEADRAIRRIPMKFR